jgi:hypothetical protein
VSGSRLTTVLVASTTRDSYTSDESHCQKESTPCSLPRHPVSYPVDFSTLSAARSSIEQHNRIVLPSNDIGGSRTDMHPRAFKGCRLELVFGGVERRWL